jgi:hypothetical protein
MISKILSIAIGCIVILFLGYAKKTNATQPISLNVGTINKVETFNRVDSNDLFEAFKGKETSFAKLQNLLSDEYENTILEVSHENFSDFVLSKSALQLLKELDVAAVHINVDEQKYKVCKFELGDSWQHNNTIIYSSNNLDGLTAITKNWYSE